MEVVAGTWGRRDRRLAQADEQGFSLVEVLIALSVLLVVLLPAADLLMTTSQVVGSSQFRGTAQQLANADVAQLQAVADTSTGVTPPYTTANMGSGFTLAIGTPADTNGVAAWPAISSPKTDTVQSETYTQYIVGDWCGAASATASSWAPATSGAVVFVVAVKVVWGPHPSTGATGGTSVMAYGALPQQSGWTVPTAAGNTDLCPTELS